MRPYPKCPNSHLFREMYTAGRIVPASTLDLHEQIRLRAYALYEQRGREGHEVDDWLQAESEVTQQKTKTIFP